MRGSAITNDKQYAIRYAITSYLLRIFFNFSLNMNSVLNLPSTDHDPREDNRRKEPAKRFMTFPVAITRKSQRICNFVHLLSRNKR